jgi:hypothetical protein
LKEEKESDLFSVYWIIKLHLLVFATLRWYEYNVSFYEQRFLAVILLGITLWVVRQLSRLKPEIKILFMTAFDANDNDL